MLKNLITPPTKRPIINGIHIKHKPWKWQEKQETKKRLKHKTIEIPRKTTNNKCKKSFQNNRSHETKPQHDCLPLSLNTTNTQNPRRSYTKPRIRSKKSPQNLKKNTNNSKWQFKKPHNHEPK